MRLARLFGRVVESLGDHQIGTDEEYRTQEHGDVIPPRLFWEEEIATFPYYWNGGLVWQGPFGTRSDDTFALGFARAWFSDSLADQSTETVLECAYNWYVNDVLLLGVLTYITY